MTLTYYAHACTSSNVRIFYVQHMHVQVPMLMLGYFMCKHIKPDQKMIVQPTIFKEITRNQMGLEKPPLICWCLVARN